MPTFNLAVVVSGVDQGASKVLKQTGSAATGLGKSGKGAQSGVGGLTSKISSLKSQVLPAAAIVTGFGVAVAEAFSFAREGAQIERLRTAGEQLASSLDGNFSRVIATVSAAAQGMVSDTAIIAGTNRAMMLGLGADADQLGQLMQVAAFRARAMGLTTEAAFNDIVTGVGRMSPLILDNLGIVVDSKAKYDEWAAANGRAASSLTAVEKKAILLSSVLEEGNAQIEEAGGLTVDNAAKFEQLDASWTNFMDNLKTGLAGPAANVVLALDRMLFGSETLENAFTEQSASIAETTTSFAEYERQVILAATKSGLLTDFQTAYINGNGDLVDVLVDVLGQTEEVVRVQGLYSRETLKAEKATGDFTQAIGFEAPSAVSKYVDAARDGIRANEAFAGSTEDVIVSMDDLKTIMSGPVGEENERYREQQRDIREEMEDVEAQIVKLQTEQGFYAASTDEITVAQFKAAQASDRLTTAQQQLAENSDPEKVNELQAAVSGAQIAFDKAAGSATNASGAYVDNSEKISALQEKHDEFEESITEAAAVHRDEINNIIFDLAKAELAAGGFSDAEREFLQTLAEDFGLVDRETELALLGIDEAMIAFAEGRGPETVLFMLGMIRDAALDIPKTINITVAVNAEGGAALAAGITGRALPSAIPTTGPQPQRGPEEEALPPLPVPPSQFPGFQTGIDIVPRPMLAMLHQGEQVVTREDNPNIPGNGGGRGGNEFHLHITQGAAVDVSQMRSAFGFIQSMEA